MVSFLLTMQTLVRPQTDLCYLQAEIENNFVSSLAENDTTASLAAANSQQPSELQLSAILNSF